MSVGSAFGFFFFVAMIVGTSRPIVGAKPLRPVAFAIAVSFVVQYVLLTAVWFATSFSPSAPPPLATFYAVNVSMLNIFAVATLALVLRLAFQLVAWCEAEVGPLLNAVPAVYFNNRTLKMRTQVPSDLRERVLL
jgi:hypothetical protein